MVDFELFMRDQNLVCIQLPTFTDSAGMKLSCQTLLSDFTKQLFNSMFTAMFITHEVCPVLVKKLQTENCT